MFRTIRARISLPFIVLVLVAVAGLGVYLYDFVRATYEDNLRRQLINEAVLLAGQAVAPLQQGDAAALATLAQRYAGPLEARITIIRADGVVAAETQRDPAGMENHASRPEVRAALSGQQGWQVRYSDTLKTDMLYAAVPITAADGTRLGVARLAVPLSVFQANLSHLRNAIIFATLAATVLAILLAMLIGSATVRPLLQLTSAAHQVSIGQAQALPWLRRKDEIGQLGESLNRMADQLSARIEALKREQGMLAAVLAQMTDGVIIAGPSGSVQLINPAAVRIFNASEHEALGSTVIEVVRHHQLVALWQRCRETGQTQTTTLEMTPGRRFIQAVAISLDESQPGSGLQGSVLLLFQDFTRLRRLEIVRRDFISNVSHELRTPLAALKALAETLKEGALEDPPAAHRFLDRMDAEIDTLTQMVRELLELSRIESGQVPLDLKPLAPAALIAPPVERMRLQAERAGLSLSQDIPAGLPDVIADGERMGQVLVNLIHNAIKFTPPGGRITVSAWREDDHLVVAVRDSGVGIAPEDLTRIFERFYKADRARTSGGTGLGLSIARHLVEAHGGRIWAESSPGEGSSFYFTLPLQA